MDITSVFLGISHVVSNNVISGRHITLVVKTDLTSYSITSVNKEPI